MTISEAIHLQSDPCGPDVSLEPRPGVVARGNLRRLEGRAALTRLALVRPHKLVQFLHERRMWDTNDVIVVTLSAF